MLPARHPYIQLLWSYLYLILHHPIPHHPIPPPYPHSTCALAPAYPSPKAPGRTAADARPRPGRPPCPPPHAPPLAAPLASVGAGRRLASFGGVSGEDAGFMLQGSKQGSECGMRRRREVEERTVRGWLIFALSSLDRRAPCSSSLLRSCWRWTWLPAGCPRLLRCVLATTRAHTARPPPPAERPPSPPPPAEVHASCTATASASRTTVSASSSATSRSASPPGSGLGSSASTASASPLS